jgi:hypothetical protein
MFLTTTEFLPQHRQPRQQTLQIVSAAEARGQTRMAEMNRQVADNLKRSSPRSRRTKTNSR